MGGRAVDDRLLVVGAVKEERTMTPMTPEEWAAECREANRIAGMLDRGLRKANGRENVTPLTVMMGVASMVAGVIDNTAKLTGQPVGDTTAMLMHLIGQSLERLAEAHKKRH